MKLNCVTRTELGKKSKKLRALGRIPAELFGSHTENKHLSVDAKELTRVYKNAGTHELIELSIDGQSPVHVLIGHIEESPYSKIPLSVGFHAVAMDEKIHTFIPIQYDGESPMARLGFPILKLIDELEIEALPKNVPESLKISLNVLSQEESKVYIKDLKVPKGVKILHIDPEQVVVIVGDKTKEEAQEKNLGQPETLIVEEEQKEKS